MNGDKKPKFIFVMGSSISGLGKGVTTAALQALLAREYKLLPIKFDGYFNPDPGVMNPDQHGEVYVTEDGGEVDLDAGHYERATGQYFLKEQSFTAGRQYEKVIKLAREGVKWHGRTVRFIPEVRDLLMDDWLALAKDRKADIVTVEIGGNVGDMEADLALVAARGMVNRVGRENIMYVLLSPVVEIKGGEYKSKLAQTGSEQIGSFRITPDLMVLRPIGQHPLDGEPLKEIKHKISDYTGIPLESIVVSEDLKTVNALPRELAKQGVADVIRKCLNINVPGLSDEWHSRLNNIDDPKDSIRIAICGKYNKQDDSYLSVKEALTHAGAARGIEIKTRVLGTDSANVVEQLSKYDGIIVPGGYGKTGIEGKIAVIKYAREQKMPYLGICYGMQLAAVEFARNVCGLSGAHTVEVDPDTPHPIVKPLPEQIGVTQFSETQRLGAQEAKLVEGSLIARLYDTTTVSERHRHRNEINPDYHEVLEKNGLRISGRHAEREHIAEFMELPEDVHPYFVGTQAHPEFKSRLLKPAPLFQGLVDAAYQRKKEQTETAPKQG